MLPRKARRGAWWSGRVERSSGCKMSDAVPAYANVPGNYYDKYNTRNPVARYLMSGFLKSFDALAERTGVRDAYEVGCGEGHLSMRLCDRGWAVRGSDLEAVSVEAAN